MNHDYYTGPFPIHGTEYEPSYQSRFKVIFSRYSMQFSIEVSATSMHSAVYKATKLFIKYVPENELWDVFKVERV